MHDPGSLYLTSMQCQLPAMMKEVVDKTNSDLKGKKLHG